MPVRPRKRRRSYPDLPANLTKDRKYLSARLIHPLRQFGIADAVEIPASINNPMSSGVVVSRPDGTQQVADNVHLAPQVGVQQIGLAFRSRQHSAVPRSQA